MLLAALPAMLLTSCRFEDEDYFDESASLRIEHAVESIQKTLVSAPQGWVMQYYADTSVDGYEGFNLFAKFEDSGKVTMAGNHRYLRDGNSNKYTEFASLYKMLLEDGPVLAFNTWNDILTVFVDPVDPSAAPGSLVKDGAGMGGDHNFVVMSYDNNEIILRGERHSAEVRLVACDRSWQDYIADTETMKSYITSSSVTSYYVTNGTDTLYFLNPRSGHFRYTERIDDPLHVQWKSCCFTPDGFRLEHQDTIGSNKFQEFKLAEDKTCLYNEDQTVQVIACWDNYVVNHTALWQMDAERFSAEQKSLFDQLDAAFKVFNSACSMASVGIGKSSGSGSVIGLVVTFYTNTAKTKKNTVGLEMKFSKPAYGEIQLVNPAEAKVDKNMEAVVNRSPEVENLVRAFAATLQGTYKMTPDNYFLPVSVEFAPINGGTAFKLN